MITRVQAQNKTTVQIQAFFLGVVAPTFTLQNRNVASAEYGKFLNLDVGVWSTTPTQNPMAASGTVLGLYESVFAQATFSEYGIDTYLIVLSSNSATTPVQECEIWQFGSIDETSLQDLHKYVLAPRVEISRPDSVTVQRSFFDDKTAGNEVLRFTSVQNPTAGPGSPEEVQTNNTDLIGA